MKQTSKDMLAMIAIAIVLIAVATIVFYLPQHRQLCDLEDKAAKLKASVASDKAQIKVVPELQDQVSELQSRYKDFDRRLPKQKDFEGPLKEISANISAERLGNPSIQPGNGSREELFAVQPINMQFEGSYMSLASFLKRVNAMERITRVQKLVVSSDPKSDKLKIQLQLNIYHQG